jgi:hypothetical protein
MFVQKVFSVKQVLSNRITLFTLNSVYGFWGRSNLFPICKSFKSLTSGAIYRPMTYVCLTISVIYASHDKSKISRSHLMKLRLCCFFRKLEEDHYIIHGPVRDYYVIGRYQRWGCVKDEHNEIC